MGRFRAPRLPNRWRITGWIVASVLLVTFLVGILAAVQVEDRFTAQIDEQIRSQAAGMRAAFDVIDREDLEQLARDVPAIGSRIDGLTVIDPSGDVLSVPSGPMDDPDPPLDTSARAVGQLRSRAGAPFDVRSADGSVAYRAMSAQLPDGGLLVVTRSLAERDEAVNAVVRVLAFTGVIAAILISVVVAVVTSLVTHPLDAMIDTAEAISEGDLTSRVPTAGVEDVTRLATALNQMLDRIEQAFADREASEGALRRFVSDASHELRTPLAAVLGYAELHQSGMAGDQAAVDRGIDRIRSEGERMRLIVDELLTLARLDEGRPMERAPVDLGELVRQAVGDARTVAPQRSVTIDVPDEPVTVSGDAMSLRQAVDNLLANARNHTPAEAPVHVSVHRGGGRALIRVRDSGPGLEPEAAARAFDRFYRADSSRSRPGGSGLGLAIVAAIAESHQGSATVDSSPGEGATFTLDLPVG
ncbi:MAG: HAMP domain-containing histidine kinase [Acidimicrobiales bacterium]|nr:HAMP domain-containing histidine kinase [Acidimicrobiales bacterium]